MANGKAAEIEATALNKEWEDMKKQTAAIVNLFGGLIFMPAILLVGICYGIRAGVIVGFEKTLSMLKGWGK
jgi:hypothetical protein